MPPDERHALPNAREAKRPRLQMRPPHPPRATNSQMRTLTDLLGAGASRADSALGHSAPADAWSSLVNTVHNLPSASLPPPTAGAEDDKPVDMQMQMVPQMPAAAYAMRGLARLPLDLSLKTRLRVYSPASLAWTRLRPQALEYVALRDVLAAADHPIDPKLLQPGDASSRTRPSTVLQAAARALLYRRLVHFQFPTSPLSHSLASNWHNIFATDAGRASQTDPNVQRLRQAAMSRIGMWQGALQSLYYGFHHRHIAHFYVLLPGSTVVFRHMRDDKGTPTAILSPATPGLRSLLSDYIVPFTICRPHTDATNHVSVRVHSAFAVHTLYNFVMCAAHKLSGATDVPTLIADHPFREGTPVSADVQHAREAQVLADPAASAASTSTRFSVQIAGLLTPRQVTGICDALVYTQCAHFTAVLDTERRSVGVNNMNASDDDDESSQQVLTGDEQLSRVAAFPHAEGLFAVARQGEG